MRLFLFYYVEAHKYREHPSVQATGSKSGKRNWGMAILIRQLIILVVCRPQYKRIAAFVGDWTFLAPRRFMLDMTKGTHKSWAYCTCFLSHLRWCDTWTIILT